MSRRSPDRPRHAVTHDGAGRVVCSCGWQTPADVDDRTRADRFAVTHLRDAARRRD